MRKRKSKREKKKKKEEEVLTHYEILFLIVHWVHKMLLENRAKLSDAEAVCNKSSGLIKISMEVSKDLKLFVDEYKSMKFKKKK